MQDEIYFFDFVKILSHESDIAGNFDEVDLGEVAVIVTCKQ